MSRPGFYFCFCPDFNLLKMHIERLLESSGNRDWQKKTIWLDEQENEDTLWKALNVPSMAGPPRALILRKCDSVPVSDRFWSGISPSLRGFRPSIWPFFCFESSWDKGKPKISPEISRQKYFKFAREKGWIWEFPGLTRQNIARYISRKCTELGIEPGPGVVDHLTSILPMDSHGIDKEIEKLSLLVPPETTILKEHLEAVSSHLDMDIFSFLQEIQRGKGVCQAWSKIFKEQLRGQELLFPFLGLLLREARILWHLATGQDSKIKLHPGIRQRKTSLARSLGLVKISMLWDLALEAESGVKSGLVNTDQAMDNLTAKLFKLFSC